MGPAIRAAREQVAQERLLAAAETLAGRFGLQAQHEALAAARTGIRDPLVAGLFQREAIADLLDALLTATEPTAELPAPDERLADLTAAAARRPRSIWWARCAGGCRADSRLAGSNRSAAA
jgi:hypothetical protein